MMLARHATQRQSQRIERVANCCASVTSAHLVDRRKQEEWRCSPAAVAVVAEVVHRRSSRRNRPALRFPLGQGNEASRTASGKVSPGNSIGSEYLRRFFALSPLFPTTERRVSNRNIWNDQFLAYAIVCKSWDIQNQQNYIQHRCKGRSFHYKMILILWNVSCRTIIRLGRLFEN